MYFLFYLILFFFNDTATTEIYTLSLHDALPIWAVSARGLQACFVQVLIEINRNICICLMRILPVGINGTLTRDRKSTRLNSSHMSISYAVFCLKKKKILIFLLLHIISF